MLFRSVSQSRYRIAITGTLAATGVGFDTFTGTGIAEPQVEGSLIVTESGLDTFWSIGTVLVSGSLNAFGTVHDAFVSTGTLFLGMRFRDRILAISNMAVPTPEENATAVLNAAVASPIASNTKKVNDVTITGAGVDGNLWRPS